MPRPSLCKPFLQCHVPIHRQTEETWQTSELDMAAGRGLPLPWQTSVQQVPSLLQPQCRLLMKFDYSLKTSVQMHMGKQNLSAR
jgi:hypothetical protein